MSKFMKLYEETKEQYPSVLFGDDIRSKKDEAPKEKSLEETIEEFLDLLGDEAMGMDGESDPRNEVTIECMINFYPERNIISLDVYNYDPKYYSDSAIAKDLAFWKNEFEVSGIDSEANTVLDNKQNMKFEYKINLDKIDKNDIVNAIIGMSEDDYEPMQ